DSGQIHERVPMIRRAGDDGMNVIALHQFAKILVLHGHLAVLRELLGGGFGMTVVHVANRDHVAKIGRASAVTTALTAATDQRDSRTIIGTERLGLRGMSLLEFNKPRWHAAGGGDGGGGLEETAAIDVKGFRLHGGLQGPRGRSSRPNS